MANSKAKQLLSESYVSEMESLSREQLANALVDCEKQLAYVKERFDADEKLTAAKEVVKDLSEGYRAALKYESAKIKAIIDRIKELDGEGEEE